MKEGGQRPSPVRLCALLAVMVSFWAANFIVAKIALRSFPPLLVSTLRTTLAASLAVPLFVWRRRQQKPVTRSDIPMLLLLGVLGMAANQVFFVFGMDRTSVAHSSLVIGLTPMLVLMLAAAVGQERLSGRKLAGMAVAIGGILILNASKTGPATPFGDLLILGSGVAFAVFTVFGKTVARRHTSLTVNTFAYAGGALILLPASLWYAPRFAFGRVPLEGWAAIVYMALFPSLICYLIYYYALTHIPASRVSALSYLQPLLATAAAALALGERVTESIIGGGLLVLTGVWLTERG